MEETVVKVTRKGQVTIPVQFRRLQGIREGSRVAFRASPSGLILVPLPNIEDLAGVDAGKISYEEAVKALNEMRSQDRY